MHLVVLSVSVLTFLRYSNGVSFSKLPRNGGRWTAETEVGLGLNNPNMCGGDMAGGMVMPDCQSPDDLVVRIFIFKPSADFTYFLVYP